MTDPLEDNNHFIGYCEIHCRTERALFSGKHVNRMLELAGHPENFVLSVSNGWYTMHGDMEELCALARARLKDNLSEQG